MSFQKRILIVGVLSFLIGAFTGSIVVSNLCYESGKHISISSQMKYEKKSIEFPIVAVTIKGEGVLEYAKLTIIPGTGKKLLKLNPFVETDTQYSFETAVEVGCRLAKVDCNKYDFILEFKTNASLVGGPSAGAAMTLATYLLLKNKEFPKNIAITGTILRDGKIGQVGGIFEKALAAAKSGKKIFFVPKGQSLIYRYEKIEKKKEIGPFSLIEIYYKPVPFNITDYFKKNYGMEIVEVSNISELVEYINRMS